MAKDLELDDMDQLPVGAQVVDWEGDALEQEAPGEWFYKHQPIRGNVARAFKTADLHRSMGPLKLLSVPKLRDV